MKIKPYLILQIIFLLGIYFNVDAENIEELKYGDFENWVTRNIKESAIIGGNVKQVYAVAPNKTINNDEPYVNMGGSPRASSNVMAKVVGITKTSNAVSPDVRAQGNRCCKLETKLENCKAIGIINIDVLVAGALFLGKMLEPVKSTSEPYSKMEMGIPYTKRPKALVYDYKLFIPEGVKKTYSSGFGKKKTLNEGDKAEVYIYLQRRWEDADGNIYAKRVGTGRELLGKTTKNWVNGHRLEVMYGDITQKPEYMPYMKLIPEEKSYYARNSRGDMKPVKEIGWDDEDATPTHMVMMFTAGSGEPFTGTIGQTLWVDNVRLAF